MCTWKWGFIVIQHTCREELTATEDDNRKQRTITQIATR